jgi:hypothetical protein
MDPLKPPPRPKPLKSDTGTPFQGMTREQKTRFVAKVILCVITFGFVFPNVMSD